MNIERLQKQLEIDEGVVYKIYEDHLGYATFGIGHLITTNDLESGLELGTPVSEERVAQAFKYDVAISVSECQVLYNMWDTFPEEVQEILVNIAIFWICSPTFSYSESDRSRKHTLKYCQNDSMTELPVGQ